MILDMWAAFCGREGLDFQFFCAGADAITADRDLWTDRGFAVLRDFVRSRS